MTIERLKTYVHWLQQEKDPDEDRILLAQDLLEVLRVVSAAATLMSEEDAMEAVSHYNALFILKDALDTLKVKDDDNAES